VLSRLNPIAGEPRTVERGATARSAEQRPSPTASALWKRRQRQLNRGTKYWLDHWLKTAGDVEAARAAYNAYMRQYMRRYRARRRFVPPPRATDVTMALADSDCLGRSTTSCVSDGACRIKKARHAGTGTFRDTEDGRSMEGGR
jgi:hypothetical protein